MARGAIGTPIIARNGKNRASCQNLFITFSRARFHTCNVARASRDLFLQLEYDALVGCSAIDRRAVEIALSIGDETIGLSAVTAGEGMEHGLFAARAQFEHHARAVAGD